MRQTNVRHINSRLFAQFVAAVCCFARLTELLATNFANDANLNGTVGDWCATMHMWNAFSNLKICNACCSFDAADERAPYKFAFIRAIRGRCLLFCSPNRTTHRKYSVEKFPLRNGEIVAEVLHVTLNRAQVHHV